MIRRGDIMGFDFDVDEVINKVHIQTMNTLGCPYKTSVDVSIVDEEEIRRLNSEYRDIDKVTDVLSFPMNEFDEAGCFSGESFELSKTIDPETEELLLGDVIICAEKVRSQAAEYGHSEMREFAFLVVHSLLHLSGFDHIDTSDRELMESKQDEILNKLDIRR